MGRLSERDHPTVLTARGRRVAAVAVAVSTTAVAVALTVPGLGDAEPSISMIGNGTTMQPTSPATEPSSPTAPTERAVTEPPGDDSAAPTTSPPLVVNGREQPPRVEPSASASGRLAVVPGTAAAGPGTQVLTYRVEIEAELPFDGPAFAAAVHTTLADPRGWASKGYAFQRVDGGAYDMRLILASPALTDRLCAPLLTRGEVSCRNGDAVVLNALRWDAGDLAAYREYLVNHEVGHRIGRGHVECPGPGEPAPVMMQQTYGLDGCLANPWPLSGE